MAAPRENVRELQQQVQRIQVALQAFNTPEGPDRKTLAERLEGSDTHEYIVLRALLKKHLGFVYDPRAKTYSCPVVENLQQLSILRKKIEQDYTRDLEEAILHAASAALKEVIKTKKDELKIIDNIEQNIHQLQDKIIRCENIEDLNRLEEELISQEESFKRHKEYIQKEVMTMYAKVFRAELDKTLPEIKGFYSGQLDLILPAIKSAYQQLQQPVLTFSPEEARKYGVDEDEKLLPAEKRGKLAVDWQRISSRTENISLAIEDLELSMNSEGAPNSKVKPYNPTQRARELVDSVGKAVSSQYRRTADDFLSVRTSSTEAENTLIERATDETMAVSNAMRDAQRNLKGCRGELEKQRRNLELKIQAEGIVRNYRIETGAQKKDQAVLDLIEIERAAQALEIAPAQLAWLPPLKEAMLENLEQEGRLITDECKKMENREHFEAMANRLIEIEKNMRGLGISSAQSKWLQEAKDAAAIALCLKARLIVANYTGEEKELGSIGVRLIRIQGALEGLGVDAGQKDLLLNLNRIAVLKKDANNVAENYIGKERIFGFKPVQHLNDFIAIQRQISQLLGAADEPLLSALQTAVEKEAAYIRLMEDADLASIFAAIREKNYEEAARLVRVCVESIREREAQAAIEPPPLSMGSSSQAASSSASSSSSSSASQNVDAGANPNPASAPNPVGLNSVARSRIRSNSEAKLTPHEDMPEYADNADKGDMPLAPHLFRQFLRNYSETKEEGLLSVIRTQRQRYDNMAEVMDRVLSNPLTDTRGVSTASARAVRMTLGCSKEDLLNVSHDYKIYKGMGENSRLNGATCFQNFINEHHQAQYRSVLQPLREDQPALNQGPKK